MTMMDLFNQLDIGTESVREGFLRMPFNYAGSKFRSLKHILPHIPQSRTYVEVFGGSGAILLNKEPSDLEVYNDRYGGVVAFFRCVKDDELLDRLLAKIGEYVYAREEFTWCKETWENCSDPVERAARWFYMNATSFGSLSRNFGRAINSRFKPFDRVQKRLADIWAIHGRVKNVLIENQDWRIILKDFDATDTVFYIDPPYLTVYGGAYKHDMNSEVEHKELLDTIFSLKGCAVVSTYPNRLYGAYSWDEKYEWEVDVSLKSGAQTETNYQAGTNNSRTKAIEQLFIKA